LCYYYALELGINDGFVRNGTQIVFFGEGAGWFALVLVLGNHLMPFFYLFVIIAVVWAYFSAYIQAFLVRRVV